MLTAAQREKCRSIAQALDAGDQKPWLKAEGRMTPEEKGAVWDLRQHVVATDKREAAGVLGAARKTSRIESRSLDLDYWPPDVAAREPDDDDDGQPCAACDGTGRDAAGNPCAACNGTGKAPDTDEEEEDEDGV